MKLRRLSANSVWPSVLRKSRRRMNAAGQEMKRMGLSAKNMYVVPNNIVGQWKNIFSVMYPNAKLLCVAPKNFTPNKREKVLERIRDEEFDGIIILTDGFAPYPKEKPETERRLQMKTTKECPLLGKMPKRRTLPQLPDEFDKEYVVDVDTMTDRSFSLLRRSGYVILHRPYFAMCGSTHKKYTLNPHTKQGVNAAKVDSASISFCEFLELFENTDESRKDC